MHSSKLLVFMSVMCVALFVFGAYFVFKEDTGTLLHIYSFKNSAKIGGGEQNINTETETQKNDADTEVLSEGTALGKITESFFSPYTAKQSYNNVYLYNRAGVDVDIKDALQGDINFKITKNSEPQVLIMHTHTTESYMLNDNNYYTENDAPRNLSEEYNTVAVGEVFCEELTAAGITVIHDKTVHDNPQYTGSYSRSEETIKRNLEKYPGIKVVLDLHRDSVSNGENKVKGVVDVNGEKAAQIMLVMGCNAGTVSGYGNWYENFKLAVKYQQTLEVMYPGLARALNFCACKYNQNLTTGSMLIEIGTEANTLTEAKLGARCAAKSLCALLNTLV